MTTDRLYEFYILAITLNFSRAARQLYISQSILSRHLQEIEQELGVSLFIRNTHNVRLTKEGEYLYSQTGSLLSKASEAVSALSLGSVKYRDTVRILCQEQVLCAQILKIIEDFETSYPQTRLQITPGITASSLGQLTGYDLMLSPCDFSDRIGSVIEMHYLMSQNTFLAAARNHRLCDKREITLSDLENENLLIPYADELFGPYALNGQLVYRKCRGNVRRVSVANPQEALLSVELGRGIMIIPASFKHRVYGNTHVMRISDNDCTFPIYAYLNRNTSSSATELILNSFRFQSSMK